MNKYKNIDWLLGGELVTESEPVSPISNIITMISSVNSEDYPELKEHIEAIHKNLDAMVDEISLDESAIAAAFIVPLLSSVGIAAIGIALNRYMNGDSVIPTPILNVLNKLANWVERGDKEDRRSQIEKSIIKTGKVSPREAKKISEMADKKKLEELKKKFPRLATK